MVAIAMNKVEKQIFIYPTDTVWGIGAALSNSEANELVLVIKRNKETKPLSILFHDLEQLRQYLNIPSEIDDKLRELYQHNLTLLFPNAWLKNAISKNIYRDSSFIGARVASTDLQKKIQKFVLEPITTTSLNIDGQDAIINEKDALAFKSDNAPNAIFITQGPATMSGYSSSILSVELSTDNKIIYSVIRKGSNFSKLENLLEL
jgi:L-threonylcarbamoyladenylate synthase